MPSSRRADAGVLSLAIVLTFVAACMSFNFFELPIQRIGQRVRHEDAPGEVAIAAPGSL
jgi:peptidoglycan/LPS O-acetylase OafA/YrhL